MNFAWSPDQEALYRGAFEFASSEKGTRSASDTLAWQRLGTFGLLGLCLPAMHGGAGLGALETARVIEATAHGGVAPGRLFSACAHLFAAAMPIAEHGSEYQRTRFLGRMASGECIGANAITESQAGSDAYALETRAERQGDFYVLSGVKSFVTNGPIADLILAYASTNREHGWLGISAFLVERGTPGLTSGAAFDTHGLTGSPIGSVYFDACKVPVSHRLGAEGSGARIFESSMRWERCCLFAMYLGVLERQLEAVTRFAQQRKQFKKPISQFQAVSHRIVDMKLRLESARLLLYRAAWLIDQGEDATEAISLSKLAVSEAAVQSGIDAIRIHGGAGVMTDTGIPSVLDDALPALIFSGTNEIQHEILARRLGL